jgi:stage V sporulation protein B
MSIVPAISSQLELYRYSEAGKYASGALKLAFLIGIPCSVGLYLMAENMIKLLFTTLTPAQTQLATSLLKTSAVGVVFLSLVQTTTGILQGAGDVRGPVVNLAVGSTVKIILLLTLIRVSDINIQGAAISTVACYGVAALLDLIRAKRKLVFTLDLTSCVLKPALCAAIMGALIYVIAPLWHTIIVVALGALTYIGLIMAMRVLREDDFALLPGGARLLKGLNRLKLY